MNGPWQFLLKVVLLTWVPFLALQTYVVRSVILNNAFREQGDRWTAKDDRASVSELKMWHQNDLAAFRVALLAELKTNR